MDSDRSVKQNHLVVYDYGQGGVWAFVKAESERQIIERFPELRVVTEQPRWMSDEDRERIMRSKSYDIDDPPRGLLAELLRARE